MAWWRVCRQARAATAAFVPFGFGFALGIFFPLASNPLDALRIAADAAHMAALGRPAIGILPPGYRHSLFPIGDMVAVLVVVGLVWLLVSDCPEDPGIGVTWVHDHPSRSDSPFFPHLRTRDMDEMYPRREDLYIVELYRFLRLHEAGSASVSAVLSGLSQKATQDYPVVRSPSR